MVISEIENENTPSSPPVSAVSSRKSQQLFRFFSVSESGRSSAYVYGDINAKPQWEHSFTSKEFLLKIAQILVAIICAGLYSGGIHSIKNSITTQMFPNVICSAFIIITSVIIISYVLGHVMPEVLIRIFNTLGAILYFVSAAITGQYWVVQGQFEASDEEQFECADEPIRQDDINMLLAETVLTVLNSFLYGIDVYFSMKRTINSLDMPIEIPMDRRKSKV